MSSHRFCVGVEESFKVCLVGNCVIKLIKLLTGVWNGLPKLSKLLKWGMRWDISHTRVPRYFIQNSTLSRIDLKTCYQRYDSLRSTIDEVT